jgi:penicillin-binding protein 1A
MRAPTQSFVFKKKMPFSPRLARLLLWLSVAAASGAAVIGTGVVLYLAPGLPSVEQLRDVSFQIPLRVYTSDGQVIGEFGEKRRTPVQYADIPPGMIQALIAAEDDSFFRHRGIDYPGLARAAFELVRYQEIRSGGSTITMQVARNFFLDRSQKFTRKFNEILLARRIEQELSKEEILELYVNKIYLGHRAYGIAAAADVYYGKPLGELSLAQLAMIAGLPKAPSAYNPITNPDRAMQRRDWILQRMHQLGQIDDGQLATAQAEPNTASFHGLQPGAEALHVADLVRSRMIELFGESVTELGYRVYTTLDAGLQKAANDAVFAGLMGYDQRHGWRGAEGHVELPQDALAETGPAWPESAAGFGQISKLEPAIVVTAGKSALQVLRRNGELADIPLDSFRWARRHLDTNALGPELKSANEVAKAGDVVRIYPQPDGKGGQKWLLGQVPAVNAALVALRPEDGAVAAMVGGYSYVQSRFNRALQGDRQAGSSFKPFLYAAALENGFTPASIINDAPIVFDDPSMDKAWRPENDNEKFYGPMRLRHALYLSRNLVSVRLLMGLPIDRVIDYIDRLGIPRAKLPRNLSLALGSASLTPAEVAAGYAVFANGGYRVEPWLIDRVEDNAGNIVWEQKVRRVCRSCSDEGDADHAARVMDARTAFILNSMMQDVIRRGTATRALSLQRDDIAGKTGTSNEMRDAWFAGYHPSLVATVWMGFDNPQSLGRGEYGGTAALPIWIDFMGEALRGVPATYLPQPPGIVTVRIDPVTGLRARTGQPDAQFEYFFEENQPGAGNGSGPADDGSAAPAFEQLF